MNLVGKWGGYFGNGKDYVDFASSLEESERGFTDLEMNLGDSKVFLTYFVGLRVNLADLGMYFVDLKTCFEDLGMDSETDSVGLEMDFADARGALEAVLRFERHGYRGILRLPRAFWTLLIVLLAYEKPKTLERVYSNGIGLASNDGLELDLSWLFAMDDVVGIEIDFELNIRNINMNTCKDVCLRNCSCKAALFRSGLNSSTGDCYLPSKIFSLVNNEMNRTRYDFQAFIKEQEPEPATHIPKTFLSSVILGSIIGSSILGIIIGITIFIFWRKREANEEEEDYLDHVPGMPTRSSYDDLKVAMENFTKKLDEGGFGSIFEGCLEDSTKIAVKCLDGIGQAKKSFLAEKKIIQDVAKGLAYIHEECMQKILHLDIKPPNILLDEKLKAKLSDFGLAKLIYRNQSQVMTIMRGTPGYLAPEWLSGVITEKVDVYSFGIVILEILRRRRYFEASETGEERIMLNLFRKKPEKGSWWILLISTVKICSSTKKKK
ncbi:hypothetical protein BC332_08386 [Capsicum chinense]|nr:hypothetical protein BC332_08386 [Capsicum chinense]